MGRHQLAVLQLDPVGAEQQQRVVERAGPLALAFVDADRHVHTVRPAGVDQAVDERSGNIDRVLPQALPELVRARERRPPGAPTRWTDRRARRSPAAPPAAPPRAPPRRSGGPPCRRRPRRRVRPAWPGRRRRGSSRRSPSLSGRRASNPRPSAWEADALPTELRPRGDAAAARADSSGGRGPASSLRAASCAGCSPPFRSPFCASSSPSSRCSPTGSPATSRTAGSSRRWRAGEREPAPDVELPHAVRRQRRVARRLPRQGRRAQLLGLLVRPLPRRSRPCSSAGTSASASSDAPVLGVDVQDVTGDARDFVDEYGLTYPMLRDGPGDTARRLRHPRPPRDLRDRPPGPHRRRAARPGRRRVHARAGRPAAAGALVKRAVARSRPCSRLLALPRRRSSPDCPQTTLGDIEDEVMCPICGTPLGLASRGAAGPARARLHRAPDRRLPLQGRDQARAGRPVRRRRARPPRRRRRRRRPRGRARLPDPGPRRSCSPPAASRFAATRWRGDRAPAANARPRRRPTRAASTSTWSATTCDRRRLGRHHGRRRLRGRLHLVHLALRAAARARLPVDDLRRLVRRHPGGPRARQGARPGAAVLPRLHGHVRRARHGRHRARPDAQRAPRAAAADLGRRAGADGQPSSSRRCSCRCSTASGDPSS